MQALKRESQPDRRRASRFPVDYETIFEKGINDEFRARISNVSANGFMVDQELEFGKGDRLIVRLPVVGRIEAFNKWVHNGRSGFEFERVIRLNDFMEMLDVLEG